MSIPWNEFVMIHIVVGIHSNFQRNFNVTMFDNQQFDMICTCYVLYLFLWSNGVFCFDVLMFLTCRTRINFKLEISKKKIGLEVRFLYDVNRVLALNT